MSLRRTGRSCGARRCGSWRPSTAHRSSPSGASSSRSRSTPMTSAERPGRDRRCRTHGSGRARNTICCGPFRPLSARARAAVDRARLRNRHGRCRRRLLRRSGRDRHLRPRGPACDHGDAATPDRSCAPAVPRNDSGRAGSGKRSVFDDREPGDARRAAAGRAGRRDDKRRSRLRRRGRHLCRRGDPVRLVRVEGPLVAIRTGSPPKSCSKAFASSRRILDRASSSGSS